jgi:tRNA pseudouridine55 synthase
MPAKSNHISGLLNINKPQGITSHDVVARVRKLARQRKVGHAGTLDPMATGVLLVCLGQATRLIEYLMAGRKQYRATIRFGKATDTDDAEGNIIAESDPSDLTELRLQESLATFQGEIKQVPPIFSAIKKDGQPLYKRARAGQAVTVEPRSVEIHALTWIEWQPPDLVLDVVCSPGTYIRALARDLGEAVETGAHLAALTRTASGPWTLAETVSLAQLEAEAAQGDIIWQRHLYPPDRAVAHLPRVSLDEQTAAHVRHGRQIRLNLADPDPLSDSDVNLIRAYTPDGEFLAILTQVKADDKLWQPRKVFQIGG